MKIKLYISPLILFCLLSLYSCDPTYGILIHNKTNKVIKIEIATNDKFSTIKTSKSDTLQIEIYELWPDEEMKIGIAIAELNNDMPFNSIKYDYESNHTL